MDEITVNTKVLRYLNHLDKEALLQLVRFLLVDNSAKDTVLMMADEFDKMYTAPHDYEVQ